MSPPLGLVGRPQSGPVSLTRWSTRPQICACEGGARGHEGCHTPSPVPSSPSLSCGRCTSVLRAMSLTCTALHCSRLGTAQSGASSALSSRSCVVAEPHPVMLARRPVVPGARGCRAGRGLGPRRPAAAGAFADNRGQRPAGLLLQGWSPRCGPHHGLKSCVWVWRLFTTRCVAVCHLSRDGITGFACGPLSASTRVVGWLGGRSTTQGREGPVRTSPLDAGLDTT